MSSSLPKAAANAVTVLKRTSSQAGFTNESPAKKEKVDLKAALRDASSALLVALTALGNIRAAEDDREIREAEERQKSAEAASLAKVNRRAKSRKTAVESTVYIVTETYYQDHKEQSFEVDRVYLSLTDANNSVRNHCMAFGDRDDPDADFYEKIDELGHIEYQSLDEKGTGWEVKVVKKDVMKPGSEPVEDWGRPIGAPCPDKSEDDSDN